MNCSRCTTSSIWEAGTTKRYRWLLQYLQFLSTDKYSAEQISKSFYNIACNFNISTSSEVTTVTISGLQENFEKAVGLFEEILANCKADEAALNGLKVAPNESARQRQNRQTKHYAGPGFLRPLWRKEPLQCFASPMPK